MKIAKKITSIFLSLCLVSSSFIIESFAITKEGASSTLSAEESNSSDFRITDGVLKAYTGSGGEVVVPDGVTSISTWAFIYNKDITEITFPKSLITIEDSAFKYCSNLKNINFSEGLISIGGHAFDDCDALKELNLPSSLKSIGTGAFYNCDGLTEIRLPNNLEEIGAACFNCSENLEKIHIPDSVKKIGGKAFGRTPIVSIDLPKDLTTIENGLFSECSNLENVTIPNSVTRIEDSAFEDCTRIETITLGDKVEYIGETAFNRCSALKNINLQDTITEIGGGAFAGCNQLENIHVPRNLTKINNGTFASTAIKNIDLPDTVVEIGDTAFSNCRRLNSISIPKNLKSVGDSAFRECNLLEKIELPDTVETIGTWAFANCISLYRLDLGESLKEIEPNIVSGCTNLTEIIIPDSVTVVKERAFANCDNLSNIKFSKNTTTLNANLFMGCEKLMSINLPDNITYISPYLLDFCFSKVKIYVNEGTSTEESLKSSGLDYILNEKPVQIDIATLKFDTIKNQVYTGDFIKPTVSILSGDYSLVENVDYKVEYLNNKSVGLATARITGIGNYTGVYDINFKIIPKSTTSFTIDKTTTSSVTLKWDKVSSADGYAIYRYNTTSKTYKRIATIDGNSNLTYTDSGRLSGTIYSYRIKPIKRIGSTTYYGNYSYVKAVTKLLKPVVTLKSTSKGTVTISWNKVNRASGYKIYRATSKNGSYTLVKTISDGDVTSFKNTNRTSSKYYYYKVKAYRTVDNKNYYSDYSTVKSIKVK